MNALIFAKRRLWIFGTSWPCVQCMTVMTIKTIGIDMLHELRFTATWVTVMRLVLVLILSLLVPGTCMESFLILLYGKPIPSRCC